MALTGYDTAASPDPPRDPVLDRAYAAGASEEPPARLDAAILAAARREVGARPRRLDSVLRAWRAPVALAAVLVLSVTVVLLLREEGADRLDQVPPSVAPPAADSARSSEPAASAKLESARGAAPSRDAAPQVPGAPASPPKAVEEDRRKVEAPSELRDAAPPAAEALRALPEAPSPQTSPLAKEMDQGAAAGARERAATAERETQAQRAPAPPAAATAPDGAVGGLARPQVKARQAPSESANRMEQKPRDDVAVGAPRPAWQGFERQPPEKWLERVEELRRAGRDEEAREMLAEFRKRFPQHPVPPTLDR